jgi:hypothetical protein
MVLGDLRFGLKQPPKSVDDWNTGHFKNKQESSEV